MPVIPQRCECVVNFTLQPCRPVVEWFEHSINGLSTFTSELGKGVAQLSTPTGCPSCLLRLSSRMEKRGSEPGGQEGGWGGGWFGWVDGGSDMFSRGTKGEEECP